MMDCMFMARLKVFTRAAGAEAGHWMATQVDGHSFCHCFNHQLMGVAAF